MTPALSIVIPCRNESARLPGTLDALAGWLPAHPDCEVVVSVEPGSDDTPEIARAAGLANPQIRTVVGEEARGKGFAVKSGMLAANGRIRFFMDADLSVPLRFVDAFLPEFENGAGVVFGSRRHPQSVIAVSQPFTRVAAGRAFNLALRLAGATPFADTQCGFKAFTAGAADFIFPKTACTGFGFDVEVLALAKAGGFPIVERPVEWRDAPGSKVRPLADGLAAYAEALAGARRARGWARKS